MDYSKIINRSFEIAWKYKFLWLFGMFAGGGGFNLQFDYMFDNIEAPEEMRMFFENFDLNPEMIYSLVLGFGLWILVMVVLGIISDIALIDSVNRIQRGGGTNFSTAFSSGLDFFFKYLGLAVSQFALVMIILVISVFIGIIAFGINVALGIIYILIMIPVALFIGFYMMTVFSLAERALIVRRCPVIEAFEEGHYLFKKNFSNSLIVFLIFLGFSIGTGIVVMIIWAMFGIPIGFIVTALGAELFYAFVAAFIIGLPISLVIGGFLGVFFSSFYTLFYFELVEPPQQNMNISPPLNNEPPLYPPPESI